MQKTVNPYTAYAKGLKIIESCKTDEHKAGAKAYVHLWERQFYNPDNVSSAEMSNELRSKAGMPIDRGFL